MTRRNLYSSSDEHGSFSLGKQRKPPRATLAALQWAADRAGLSYGRFMLGLTARDELQIQEEYEEWKGVAAPRTTSSSNGVSNEAAVGNEEGSADSNTAGSVPGEQRREGMEDEVSGSAQTPRLSDGVDIHTLRTLLDRLPDEVDEEYYSLILKQGLPIATLLHGYYSQPNEHKKDV